MQDSLATYRRPIVGVVVTLASLGVLLAILLPFRSHLSIAIPALVFVLPALIGVVIAGSTSGRSARWRGSSPTTSSSSPRTRH